MGGIFVPKFLIDFSVFLWQPWSFPSPVVDFYGQPFRLPLRVFFSSYKKFSASMGVYPPAERWKAPGSSRPAAGLLSVPEKSDT